jgi:hypothetical protein
MLPGKAGHPGFMSEQVRVRLRACTRRRSGLNSAAASSVEAATATGSWTWSTSVASSTSPAYIPTSRPVMIGPFGIVTSASGDGYPSRMSASQMSPGESRAAATSPVKRGVAA